MSTKNTESMENKKNIKPVLAEYIWRGGNGDVDIRSKTRVFYIEHDKDDKPKGGVDIPIWNYDGSSTNQAVTENSEIILNPCAVFTDSMRGAPHVLVLCDCFDAKTQKPLSNNSRVKAHSIFEKYKEEEALFGFEQEYVICNKDGTPMFDAENEKQGTHYCGTSIDSRHRKIMEMHLQACLSSGIKVSGINSEVLPSQMEYQIGPLNGLVCSDQLWVSRYLLMRICEMDGFKVSFDPRVLKGDWNGSGCHLNVSTEDTRGEDGLEFIKDIIQTLSSKHNEYVKKCGKGTRERLTGEHETSSYGKFSSGVGDRSASIRIPFMTDHEGKGYFEDRRPSSNVDPYDISSSILDDMH